MTRIQAIISAAVPALVAYFFLWLTKDAIFTLIGVIVFGLILPTTIWWLQMHLFNQVEVYVKFAAEFLDKVTLPQKLLVMLEINKYKIQSPEKLPDKDKKLALGKSLFFVGSVGLSILSILWSRIAPTWAGPTTIILPFPAFGSTAMSVVYHTFFVILFLVLTTLEHFYFNYFFSKVYDGQDINQASYQTLKNPSSGATAQALVSYEPTLASNIVMSIGVGLLNFAVFRWILLPVALPAFILAIFSSLLNMVLLHLSTKNRMIVSTSLRIGISVGMLLALLYLGLTVKNGWTRSNPENLSLSNSSNLFSKWFGKKSAQTKTNRTD